MPRPHPHHRRRHRLGGAVVNRPTRGVPSCFAGSKWALAQHLTDTTVGVVGRVRNFSGLVPQRANGGGG